MISLRTTVLLAVALVAGASSARAHFLWIAPDSSPKDGRVHVYFSESPEPDDPELLGKLKGLKLQQVSAGEKPQTLDLTRGDDSLLATPVGAGAQSFSLDHTYGLLDRNGEVFLLVYHGRMYPANSKNQWTPPTSEQRLPLELVPSFADGRLAVRVLWQGQPLAGAELRATPAGAEPVDGKSDALGQYSVAASRPGRYALRAKYVEKKSGEQEGKKYATVRHYSTLVVTIAGEPSNAAARTGKRPLRKIVITKMGKRPMRVTTKGKRSSAAASGLPDLPIGITSFGAALLGQNIYVCEGQLGPAHEYSLEGQSDRLLRLDLKAPQKWAEVGTVPHRSGLAMVAYDGKAYRIGGFEAQEQERRARRFALDARLRSIRSVDRPLGRTAPLAASSLVARRGDGWQSAHCRRWLGLARKGLDDLARLGSRDRFVVGSSGVEGIAPASVSSPRSRGR